MKKIFMMFIFLSMFGCYNNDKSDISLTPEEIKQGGNNQDNLSQTLLKKVLLKEMSAYDLTPDEEKFLNNKINDVKINFYLNKVSSKNVNVSQEEIEKEYNANKEQLREMDEKRAMYEIKDRLFLMKLEDEKNKYLDSLMKKYNIEEIAKSYIENNDKK